MRNMINPHQTRLFDPFDGVLTPKPASVCWTVGRVCFGMYFWS